MDYTPTRGPNEPSSIPGKDLDSYRRMFDDFRNVTERNRIEALIDIDYKDGIQLTRDERRVLLGRGQPDIWVNRTRVAINGILGVVVRSQTDPKANPRNLVDEPGSSVATDILRYSKSNAKPRWNRLKARCMEDFLVPGSTGVFVGIDAKRNVTFERIRWEELVYDYRSREDDFSDAAYMGMAKWMYLHDAMAVPAWKGKFDSGVESDGGSNVLGLVGAADVSESFSDRPSNTVALPWVDKRSQRLMIVEIYHRVGGKWYKCAFWYGGILESGPSPYLDEDGQPTNPIIAESAYVDRDNNRYGVVRDMRPLQDEINKRRSKLLHLVNSAQIQARDPSAVEISADDARLEAARPDGVIPYGWEKVPTSDMAQGQMLLLTEAKNEMERFGPNPAVLGRQGADTSGRALLTRQQAGLVELATLLDQMEDFEIRLYVAAWQRVKQFWNEEKTIRVTDDLEAPKFIGINKPKMGQVPMMGHNGGPPMVNEDGSPMMGIGQIGIENNVAEMNVDIDIDTAPATATIMQEMLADLMKLVSANPTYGQQVPFQAFLELMPIPRKRQIIAIIRKYQEEMAAQQQKQQQLQEKIAVEEHGADMAHKESQVTMNLAKAKKLEHDALIDASANERESALALDQIGASDEEDKETKDAA